MKRLTGLLLSFLMMVTTLCFPSISFGATEVVPVYLNNKAITFAANDAQPQIFQNRTYVPIRTTCDALGLTIDWNSKTETLTFTREGVTIAHTMRSKIVYINGVKQTFDTASINKNNRTLMPIRMLAESIGATVTWDNDTRSVHITTNTTTDNNSSNTNNNSSTNTNTNTNTTTSADNLTVSSIAVNTSVVNSGNAVTFTAVANSNTSVVRFSDASTGNVYEDVSEYTANSDGTRTFQCRHTFTNTGSSETVATVKAQPGNGTAFSNNANSTKAASIIVKTASSSSSDNSNSNSSSSSSSSYKSDYMVKLKTASTSLSKNDYAKLTITTKSDISKVKITNNFNDEDVVVSDYDEDGSNRVFTGKVKMSSKGTSKLYVYLYVKGQGYEDSYETVTIDVDSSSSSSSSRSLDISDVVTPSNYIYTDVESTVTIYTGTGAKKVEIRDDDDRVVASSGFYTSKTSNKITWNVNMTVKSSGKHNYTVYAYDSDDNSETYDFSFNAKNWSKGSPLILNVEQRSSNIETGDTAKFRVTASYGTSYVTITRGSSSSALDKNSSGSKNSGGDTKSFDLSFKVEEIRDTYYVHAYSSDGGAGNEYALTINGDNSDPIKISKVNVDGTSFSLDDSIEVEVITSNSAQKVWVEDSAGDRISKVYKSPDDEDDDEYTWNIDFNPTKTGRKTFTVIAQGDNSKEEDSYDFTVTITER